MTKKLSTCLALITGALKESCIWEGQKFESSFHTSHVTNIHCSKVAKLYECLEFVPCRTTPNRWNEKHTLSDFCQK